MVRCLVVALTCLFLSGCTVGPDARVPQPEITPHWRDTESENLKIDGRELARRGPRYILIGTSR